MTKRDIPLICCVLFCTTICHAVEPDFIRTTVYNVDRNQSNLVSTVYSGMGREVQSKFKIGNNKDRVISTFYDGLNRKKITTKPYIDTVYSGSFLPGGFDTINGFLKKTYREYDTINGDPFAYSEVEYYNDQSGRVKKSGSPGVNHRLGSGHEIRTWQYGVNLDDTTFTFPQGTLHFSDGFVKNLTINIGFDIKNLFDTLYVHAHSHGSFLTSRTHLLSISMDPLGSYSQKLNDHQGRTVAVWSDPGAGVNDEIISHTRYDFYGNPLEEIAPKNLSGSSDSVLIANTKYLYNTIGQNIRKETPDGTIDTFIYNKSGTLARIESYYVNADGEREGYEQNVYTYDIFGRLTEERVLRERRLVHRIRNYYDNTTSLLSDNRTYKIPSVIIDQLKNLCGKMIASTVYNYVNGNTYVVIDLFSYNDEGETEKKFKIVPGLPVQEITYNYDIHGKVLDETIICGRDTIVKGYEYDRYGRNNRVVHKNNEVKELVRYSYSDLGKTTTKSLDSIHDISYLYTIQDQIKNIQSTGPVGFQEDISYLQNSSIDTVKSFYRGLSSDSVTNSYAYDNSNRLLEVNSSKPEYNSRYSYDQVGRFKSKEEGSSVITGYQYYPETNRLKYAKDNSRDYCFDKRGNLVVDRFKNLVIEYNGQNLPVSFSFYRSIPSVVSFDSRGTVVINDDSFTGNNIYRYMNHVSENDINYRLISRVTMLYDASGNRVLKMEDIQ